MATAYVMSKNCLSIGAICTYLSFLLPEIIENAKDNPNLEFHPVLKDGVKLLTFDVDPFKSLAPIHCHCALLDNKYYTTQIYLVAQEDILYFPEQFYDFFHGVLIYFDNNIEDGLKAVEKWIPYTDMMENCAIKILACDTATDHTRKLFFSQQLSFFYNFFNFY